MQLLRTVMIGLMVVGAAWPQSAEAVLSRTRLPLSGCRGNLYARGSVTYTDSFLETNTPDGRKLSIVVENVSLPPGTELLVYIHGNEVGTIKLDKRRGGRFEIVSDSKKLAPRITLGSFVVLRLDDGTNVMW